MKKRVNPLLKLMVALALAFTATQGIAQQWMWESGALTSDGSVQVQPMSGGSAMALPQNPTGASAMASMSALTQPPTVLNAMATLPIVQEHTACEMTATEGDTAAVNADRTLLLTCRPNPEVAGSPLQWMRPNPPVAVEGEACLSPNGQRLENGAIGKTSTGLILSCQSGVWGKQPLPLAYGDKFQHTDLATFTSFVPGCGVARFYLLNLDSPAIFNATLYALGPSEPRAGIWIEGNVCGYNRDPQQHISGLLFGVSTSCSTYLDKGEHTMQMCTKNDATMVRGSVTVSYVE